MPINPIMNGGINAPLEGDDESWSNTFRTAIGTAQSSTLGVEALTKFGAANDTSPGAQTTVSQADAIAQLKAQNYDVSGIPAGGIPQAALTARMNQQSIVRRTQDMEARAHMGGTSQFVAGVVGGLGDPLNVLIAPVMELGGPARLALGARVARGAIQGATIAGAADVAKQVTIGQSLGDPDLTSKQLLSDMMLGGVAGGIMSGAFGPRPVASPGGGAVTLDMIDRLGERTGAYSAKTGIPVDDVVSNKGAIGRYQVTPIFAKTYGVTQEQIDAGLLRNPEFNAKVAQRGLDDLNKRFPNDPEAVAIAYNAGPSVARRFISSGRDYSVLPKETQDYAARIAGVPRTARVNAARMALAQTETDSPVAVKPVIDGTINDTFKTNPMRLMDEHDQEVSDLYSQALQSIVPKQDSAFTEDPEITASLARTERSAASTTPEAANSNVVGQKATIDPELAQHVSDDLASAKAAPQRLGVPEGQQPKQFEEPPPFTIDGMAADEHQKAVEAALRCGMMKGGFE